MTNDQFFSTFLERLRSDYDSRSPGKLKELLSILDKSEVQECRLIELVEHTINFFGTPEPPRVTISAATPKFVDNGKLEDVAINGKRRSPNGFRHNGKSGLHGQRRLKIAKFLAEEGGKSKQRLIELFHIRQDYFDQHMKHPWFEFTYGLWELTEAGWDAVKDICEK